MARKKKNKNAQVTAPEPAPETPPEVKYPFNDPDLAKAVDDLTHAARNLFTNVKTREQYDTLYASTSLAVDPLSYEITVLRMILADEMEKPSTAKPPRSVRGTDMENCKQFIANLCHDTQHDMDEATQAVWAEKLRVQWQLVRSDAKLEAASLEKEKRDPHLVTKLINAISTCENVRSKLDSLYREDNYAFRRQQEDGYLSKLLSEALQDHLLVYWDIAKQYNALVGRRAITPIRERIEAELRRRGQLAEGETLE